MFDQQRNFPFDYCMITNSYSEYTAMYRQSFVCQYNQNEYFHPAELRKDTDGRHYLWSIPTPHLSLKESARLPQAELTKINIHKKSPKFFYEVLKGSVNIRYTKFG